MAEPSPIYHKKSSYTLFVGGITSRGTFERSVWRLAVDSGWVPFPTSSHVEPKPRWKGSFNRFSDDEVVLFGGSDNREYFNDVWVLKVSICKV